MTAMRCSWWRAFAVSMATPMLLNRQKPMPRSGRQWWPGGRVSAKALPCSPRTTPSSAAIARPVDTRAMS